MRGQECPSSVYDLLHGIALAIVVDPRRHEILEGVEVVCVRVTNAGEEAENPCLVDLVQPSVGAPIRSPSPTGYPTRAEQFVGHSGARHESSGQRQNR